MRTERDARRTTAAGAPPGRPLTSRIAPLGGRLAPRRRPQHDGPTTLRPVAPDQAQAEAAVVAVKSATPVPALVAGAALVALAWWRARRRRQRHGN